MRIRPVLPDDRAFVIAAAHRLARGALMRAAEAWARAHGYRRLTLNVFEANHAARAVYEHLGYAPETLRYVKIL